jgi:hypothetical protein
VFFSSFFLCDNFFAISSGEKSDFDLYKGFFFK